MVVGIKICGRERGMMSVSNRQGEGERRALIQLMTADCRGGALDDLYWCCSRVMKGIRTYQCQQWENSSLC
ncbi:hypothetical protein EYF80_007456 [Liparis tanakae]|uniref:Uncharacterized protein n=1 Tax=Liparis tanakae TaxID=230148 RepID=A0A4Z2IWJ9_9TELE|nr:hypothetical protein EYF80_007456 [Liparis tanakae]